MKKHISFSSDFDKECISEYKACLYDSCCGEPIAWGYKILKPLGGEIFTSLKEQGEMVCIYPTWFLITKRFTKQDAINKYGDITSVDKGPRGGFKSETYGKTKFFTKLN